MGFTEKKERDTVFLAVKHFCICEEAKAARDGFREITVQNPKTGQNVTKYIKEYSAVEGFVTALEWYDTKKQYETRYMGYKVKMDVDGTLAVLDLPYKSRPYDAFVKFAENIDWARPVQFSAWHDRKSDGVGFCARQADQVVRWAYTRENPGGCPPAVQDRMTDEWDFREQRRWLKNQIDTVVIPAIKAAQEQREATKAKTPQPAAKAAIATATASHGGDPNDPYGDFGPVSEPDDDDNDEISF